MEARPDASFTRFLLAFHGGRAFRVTPSDVCQLVSNPFEQWGGDLKSIEFPESFVKVM